MEDYDRLKEENAKLREQLANCSRSHPHENMTVTCELRTEIARLTNQLSHAEALANANCEQGSRFESKWHEAEDKLKALSEQEPVVVTGHGAHYGDLPWGMKLYAAPVPPVRSEPEPCICLTNIFDNEPETGEKKHCHECGGTGIIQPADVVDTRAFIDALQIDIQHKDGRIAELERKLAEQQAEVNKATFIIGSELAKLKGSDNVILAILSNAVSGSEELNTLLAKAREEGRKEAVPEGVVSIDAGFDYQGGGVITPTLKLYFASGIDSNELWLSRDKAKKILSSSQNGSIQHAGEIDRLKQERDELAAQVEVMRGTLEKIAACPGDNKLTTAMQWANDALSITPSAALREIQAMTLEEAINAVMSAIGMSDAVSKLREMAAAKRKGEPT